MGRARAAAIALACCACTSHTSGASQTDAGQIVAEQPPPPASEPTVVAPVVVPTPVQPAAPTDLELHVVARADPHADVSELVGGRLVLQLAQELVFVPAKGPLVRDPSLSRGLAGASRRWFDVEPIQGRWPDAAFMAIDEQLYRWNDGWSQVENNVRHEEFFRETREECFYAWRYIGLAPWKNGSLLGLRLLHPPQWTSDPEEGWTGPDGSEPVERFDVIGGKRRRGPEFAGRDVEAFDALASGEIIGWDGQALLVWPQGSELPEEYSPPGGGELEIRGIEMIAPDRAYAFGETRTPLRTTPWLATFDGTSWTRIAMQTHGGIIAGSAAPDGETWWVTQDNPYTDRSPRQLWKLAAGDESPPKPVRVLEATSDREVEPQTVIARRGGELWLGGQLGDDFVLMHGKRRAAVFELRAAERLDAFEDFVGGSKCEAVYLPLPAEHTATSQEELAAALGGLQGILDQETRVELVEAHYLDRNSRGLWIRADATTMQTTLAAIDSVLGGVEGAVCGTPTIERTLAVVMPKPLP